MSNGLTNEELKELINLIANDDEKNTARRIELEDKATDDQVDTAYQAVEAQINEAIEKLQAQIDGTEPEGDDNA